MERVSCNSIRDMLPLYIDEVVSAETREMVETHLKGCEVCRRELEDMKQPVTLPEEEPQRLRHFVKKRERKRMLRSAAAAVCVCLTLLAAAGYFIFGRLADSEDVRYRTGFQCDNVSYVGEHNGLPTWVLFVDAGEEPVFVRQEFIYGDLVIDGERVPKEIRFYIYKSYLESMKGTWCMGYDIPDQWTLPEDYDCTVTIIFADRELRWSMREEGLFDENAEHDPGVCFGCGR